MITVREAKSNADMRRFIRFPWSVYKHDTQWVPPLLQDIKFTLNRRQSPFFEFGEAVFFLAFNGKKMVGRISAHVNRSHNTFHQDRDGFFGFYEAIDDQAVADSLFDAAEGWLRERGMTRIVGPENYTVYDEMGFLADGWDEEPKIPVIFHTYTPKYYLNHVQNAGYVKEIDWLAFLVSSNNHKPLNDAILHAKSRMQERHGFTMRTINTKDLDTEIQKIKVVMNSAWAENWGHYSYSDAQFTHMKDGLVAFYDPRMIFIVETGEGEPIGVSVTLPDINPAVQKMNGRLFPVGWIHFLLGKKRATGARTLIMGVKKEYRGRGVDIALVSETIEMGKKLGYIWSDCSLIVENNERMIRPLVRWGGKKYRTFRLFSKEL